MEQKSLADSLAGTLNIPLDYTEENGRVIILQRLDYNNKPVYYATDNVSVAATISVDQVWSANNEFPELTGEGIEINLWDGGTVLSSHQEFQSAEGSRITMRDLDLDVSNHSTHISGTMIASGVKTDAKGMAGKALIKGWDLNNDIAEMASAAADGIPISNHSYGPLCGWYYNSQIESWYWYGDPEISATEDYKFGFYNDVSADIDFIAENAPYYLIVKSAGNDRNDGPATTVSHYVWDDQWILVNAERDPDGGTDGFDCLSPLAVAKNILTVGAVDDATNMTLFSAFGPTDDGRIKPDVVSDGTDVYSSIASTNTSYTSYSGTSMSAASATGAITLLLQLQYLLQPGVNLLSSTYKSLLMHTASDLGNAGPDYSYGWGLINTKAAADVIYANSNNQGKNIYEQELHEAETVTIPVKTTSDSPFLKATLCWTDPAGQAGSPALNQRTGKLVNDLNLQVENTNTGQTIFPWVLNVENPAGPATHGTNHVDNVEQVYFANPGAADFDIKISHSGTLSGGSQIFSLVITGIETQSEIYPPQNLTCTIGTSGILLNWGSPVSGSPEKYMIYRNGSFLATSNTTSYTDASIIFDNEYSYYVTAVYSINEEEIESLGTNEIVVYPRTVRPLPYLIDFEASADEVQIKNNISGWQWGDSETLNCYYLDFSDNHSKFIATDSYSAGEAVHVSDIATTAPLLLENYSNVTLSLDYLLKTGIYDAIDELHVVYKLQGETNWQEFMELGSAFNWVHKSFELPTEICINGTQLGFYYDDQYQWGMGAGLDNIYISGEEKTRNIDLTITALNAPVSSCSLSENENVSISIKNVGSQTALAGDSISIYMNCSSNESVEEILVLSNPLLSGEILNYQLNTHVDLSNEQLYTFEFQLFCKLDNNTSNNFFTKNIEVFGYPHPMILNEDLIFDDTDTEVKIEVFPEGGTLSGIGVSGMYFYPSIAGEGDHVLTYSITDANGCQASVSTTLSVIPSKIYTCLEFLSGWNIFSINNTPDSADLMNCFQPLIENNSLIKIQDELGNSLEDWGILGGWQNNIGDLSATEGYKIKLSSNDTLVVCGQAVNYPYAIPLKFGWNIASYPLQLEYDGISIVQQLIDRGTLLKVQDEAGHSIENLGTYGGWINNIGDFKPGKGYKYYLIDNDTLWFYENNTKKTTALKEHIATVHFKSISEGNGFDHMNINLVDLPCCDLNAGDEIAVFDDNNCVGAATLTQSNLNTKIISLIASANDNEEINGFMEGNPFTLKLWNLQQNKEYALEYELIKGTSTFTRNESAIVRLNKIVTSDKEMNADKYITEIAYYPNPFSNEISIEINLKRQSEVNVEVFDQFGQQIQMIASNKFLSFGKHKLSWDGKNTTNQTVSPGVYYLRVRINNLNFTYKIISMK
ncbi:S8 family peptidase [Maribellus sediminis]|uniref:S8 family peptidase n=1 Tax=Maribellus sediminis TaxID=2696285 RepID=UPI001430618B|nr:S8 family peptidase [Maribellus sediminis]